LSSWLRIIYAIVTEVSTLLSSPEKVQLLILDITSRATRIEEILPFNSPRIASQINHFISGLTDIYFPPTETLVAFLTVNLPFYIVVFIVTLIFSYYLLLTGNKLIDQILNFVPDKKEKEIKLSLRELDVIYSGLFRQHFVASGIIGIIALLGLYLLNVPFPGVLASLIFLLSMYPLIGLPGVYLPLTA
jgi:predicted PurR-regulated permease PerM